MLVDLNRFLVTGAGGMVGRAISFGVKLPRADLDVTDRKAVLKACDKLQPSGILCLSSVDLRRCETEPFRAVQTNVLGVCFLAEEAAKRKIPIVVVSTASIFNGPFEASFDESSSPSPVHFYGQTKWLAELLLARITENHLIVRTGWLFGSRAAHHINFFDRAFDLAIQNKPIEASTDQRGSPTYLVDFRKKLGELLERGERGVVHVVNHGAATGFDIAKSIVSVVKSSSEIKPINSRELFNAGPKRSASEVLVSTKATLRSWRDALWEYLHNRKYL